MTVSTLVFLSGKAEAECNTKDGNIAYSVNYDAVDYGAIAVCFDATNISSTAVQWAFDDWNGVVGKQILGYNCAGLYTGIIIDDIPDGGCGYTNGVPNPACAQYPQQEAPVLLHMWFTPGVRNYALDGQEHLAKHESGHTLGFDHEDVCESVMAMVPGCDPNPVEPTPLDDLNYQAAYWVEGVSSLTGSSPSPASVSLGWSTTNSLGQQLCNEKEFGIWRLNRGSGSYDIHVATAGQNGTGSSFGGQPYGTQHYRVWSVTDALAPSLQGYAFTPVMVSALDDYDGDGFTDSRETYLGTDPYDDCRDNSSDDAWPLDIDINGTINVSGDVLAYRGMIGVDHHSWRWRQRLDLNGDGTISVVGDVLKFSGKIGAVCYN